MKHKSGSKGKTEITAEDVNQIHRLSSDTVKNMRYRLNSARFPLGVAFFVTLALSAMDCWDRSSVSPLFFAPILLVLYTQLYVGANGVANPHALQILAMLPLIYIVVTEHILKFRTVLHTYAVIYIQPSFLAFISRSANEAGCYLFVHLSLVASLEQIPNYKFHIFCLVLCDVFFFASAWMKQDIAEVANTLLSHNGILCGFLNDVDKSRRKALDEGSANEVNQMSTPGQIAKGLRSSTSQSQVYEQMDSAVHPGGSRAPSADQLEEAAQVPEDPQEPRLGVADLERMERSWAFQNTEPPFAEIEAACTSRRIDDDVPTWLLRRWAWAELQLLQLREHIDENQRMMAMYLPNGSITTDAVDDTDQASAGI
jgi:hypothetical protein